MPHNAPRSPGRRSFLELCGLLGLTSVVSGLAAGCSDESLSGGSDSGDVGPVIIVGAGPAGLSAGYLLAQAGVAFEILEALPTHGGRIKRSSDFVDFSIPLGAEWIHVDTDVLDEIVNDPSVEVATRTTRYDLDNDVALYEGATISVRDVGFDVDSKFIGSSWLDFFDRYIVPTVAPNIVFDTVVDTINYGGEGDGDGVEIRSQDRTWSADRVIVTVPVKMLQNGAITFTPELPEAKQEAIDEVTVWDGCKAFIEFDRAFYPTMVAFDIQPESAGQKLYYDAAYGQDSTRNVLGLFAVGTGTVPYVNLSDDDLIAFMLAELDDLFDGQATPNYRQHLFQNWVAEPFAKGAYVYDDEDWRRVRELGTSVDDKLYFAGDAYTTGNDWSSVHTAVRSARRAVDNILG